MYDNIDDLQALDALELPVVAKRGKLGKIKVQIPGFRTSTLKKNPVLIEIQDVTLIVEKSIQTPEEIERRFESVKLSNLDLASFFQLRTLAEELQREGKLPSSQEEASDPSLIAAIVDNLQVNVTRVHIRFEDSTSHPSRAFAVGVTLENFNTAPSKESTSHSSIVCRKANLNSFSVYWDQIDDKKDDNGLVIADSKSSPD